MQYGVIIPGGDLDTILALATEAEAVGWDGVFYWDGINIPAAGPMYDPWVVLAAIATCTERVRIGAIITPISRRRPWKLARETVTLDHLSHGRLVVPVGLGALDDGGFGKVGEATDLKVRAAMLDEGLEVVTGLWSGQPFSYHGAHYDVEEMTFLPPPVQTPRIPVWVVAAWPRAKSMRRALRYDGILPQKMDGADGAMTPDDIWAMRAFIAEQRAATTPFDIIMEGETPGDDPAQVAATVAPLAEAGATWWMETRWTDGPDTLRARIAQGPPEFIAN